MADTRIHVPLSAHQRDLGLSHIPAVQPSTNTSDDEYRQNQGLPQAVRKTDRVGYTEVSEDTYCRQASVPRKKIVNCANCKHHILL